jgi:di/tricarboxylate transporter
MTLEMWIALGILIAAIFLFITEWLRVDVVAIAVMVALMLTGLLTAQEAIAGFSNPAVLTIAALFIVGGGVMQTGLAASIGERILKVAGTHPGRLTLVIMIAVALLSAVMSDTGTVAVLLPAIISLGVSARISPSKLLIPLSYGSLLGGATTLIGTPPNIIVSDLLREQGLQPFRFFDYTPVGLALFATGALFMVSIGRRLLPDHKPKQDVQRVETPEELLSLYRLPDNLFRLRVRRSSDVVGKTLLESRLRQDYGLTVLDILRPNPNGNNSKDSRVKTENGHIEFTSKYPSPEAIMQAGDILIVQAVPNDVSHAAAALNLGVQPAQSRDDTSLISSEVGIAEVLLPPRSSLLGKSLVDVQFGSVYHLTVLGINRPGLEESLDLKETELRFGDILLVQGPWKNILDLKDKRRDFVVMGQPEQVLDAPARAKAPLAMLVLIGMLVVMITNLMPLATASMLAALVMILTGCLSIDEAYDAVDWKSIVLIAGMLPMATALEKVGLVDLAAQGFTQGLGNLGPMLILGGFFLLTSIFTQVLSNTATTVLVAPIALATAIQLGVQPYAFLMGVAIAASMAFASPVASPANTLVMGAGHYRFSDYIKVGLPLIFLTLLVAMLVLPLIFPF